MGSFAYIHDRKLFIMMRIYKNAIIGNISVGTRPIMNLYMCIKKTVNYFMKVTTAG